MLEKTLISHYQRWLVSPVAILIHKKIAPAHVTLAALIAGVLVIPALLYHYQYIALFLLLGSGYMDTLDGTLARHANAASPLGTIYDIMADRSVEFSAVLGLWLANPNERGLLCILMLGSMLLCITSFLVVGIFTKNDSHKGFYYSPGLVERAEAFIFFSFMILIPKIFTFLALSFISLVFITTMIRLYEFKKFQTI